MEIVLIRHAKAKRRRATRGIDRRYLTKKGERKFQNVLPKLKEYLQPIEERPLLVWSSPELRALETAHIVTSSFQKQRLSIHDFLYEGDFEAFSQEVEKVQDDTVIVLVGHQPFLNEWVYELTGREETVKKGQIINLIVLNKSPLEATLQWKISSD